MVGEQRCRRHDLHLSRLDGDLLLYLWCMVVCCDVFCFSSMHEGRLSVGPEEDTNVFVLCPRNG